MKQLLILSGKGGTGKTTIASAFIQLAKAKAYADCDVDAPNLHLLMHQSVHPKQADYYGLPKAEINTEQCVLCDLCRQFCRFDAIEVHGEDYRIDWYACEGCGVCAELCPPKAIEMKPAVVGEYLLYQGEAVFSTAQLKMGSGTSGLLVSEVKKQMVLAAAPDAQLAIIDGSPGIGCPVISSLSGVDHVLIVAEPTISGISDMERIIKTAQKFSVKSMVCINKYDTNLEKAKEIETYCRENDLIFMGKIPFDPKVVEIINQRRSIVEADCQAGQAAEEIYQQVMKHLFP